MPQKSDWADELIAKKKARGNNTVTADELRQQVRLGCESNIERWQTDDWDAKKRTAEIKKETKRLIKLRQDEDAREDLTYRYEQKGVVIGVCHSTVGKIASAKLPFNKAEWGDLLNTEGEHLGACCADISRIRDILQHALRDDGYCDVEELWEAATLAKGHGFGSDGNDPIARMIRLWDEVKDDARTSRSTGDCGKLNEDPKEALEQLYKCSGVIVWNELFDNSGPDQQFSNDVNSERALATLAICVRTLFFKMKELSVGTIEGWGVYNGDEIGESRSGVAVYRTEEMANEVCAMWNKTEQKPGKHAKHPQRIYTVEKCQVTMEHGVQKL